MICLLVKDNTERIDRSTKRPGKGAVGKIIMRRRNCFRKLSGKIIKIMIAYYFQSQYQTYDSGIKKITQEK